MCAPKLNTSCANIKYRLRVWLCVRSWFYARRMKNTIAFFATEACCGCAGSGPPSGSQIAGSPRCCASKAPPQKTGSRTPSDRTAVCTRASCDVHDRAHQNIRFVNTTRSGTLLPHTAAAAAVEDDRGRLAGFLDGRHQTLVWILGTYPDTRSFVVGPETFPVVSLALRRAFIALVAPLSQRCRQRATGCCVTPRKFATFEERFVRKFVFDVCREMLNGDRSPNLILLDVLLPQVCKRKSVRTAKIPQVVIAFPLSRSSDCYRALAHEGMSRLHAVER